MCDSFRVDVFLQQSVKSSFIGETYADHSRGELGKVELCQVLRNPDVRC